MLFTLSQIFATMNKNGILLALVSVGLAAGLAAYTKQRRCPQGEAKLLRGAEVAKEIREDIKKEVCCLLPLHSEYFHIFFSAE